MKNALKYNDKVLKRGGLENDNFLSDNQIFAGSLNHYNKDNSIISNKDLFEKIDQSMINDYEREKVSGGNNYNSNNIHSEDKRRPFRPIVFERAEKDKGMIK